MKRLTALALLACFGLATPAAQAQNLLTNPGFELPSFFGWNAFNNVFPSGDSPRTGSQGGLILGPFFNLPNASGIFQDVPVSPGDIVEGSIWAINDSSILTDSGQPDIIAGTGNTVELNIEWIDAGGNNLGVGGSTQIFDGMDPNLVLDEFVQGTVVSSPAPANAAEARLVLLFFQPPTFDGGLVFFDDASLRVIPEPTSAALLGLATLGFVGRRRS